MNKKKGDQPSIDIDSPDHIGAMPLHRVPDAVVQRISELQALYHVPDREVQVARLTYERLLTSVTLAEALLPKPSASDILVVYSGLLSETPNW